MLNFVFLLKSLTAQANINRYAANIPTYLNNSHLTALAKRASPRLWVTSVCLCSPHSRHINTSIGAINKLTKCDIASEHLGCLWLMVHYPNRFQLDSLAVAGEACRIIKSDKSRRATTLNESENLCVGN